MNDITAIDKDEGVKLSPEALTIVNNYLLTNDISTTSIQLGIPREKVIQMLNKREAKKYIDTIFLEQGYFNRGKIAQAMTDIIEKKLEELEEAEMSSTKDIADLLQMAHKMRMDELKAIQSEEKEQKPVTNQTNIQNNFSNKEMGSNYTSLLSRLSGDGKKE
jgi:hypothetical protein